jgi:pyridoxal 5'-phosphate synthase pdxS subunit
MDSLNKNLAQMFKGGVIMDVMSVEQANIAEEAGACAVMALDLIPSEIRKQNGVCRMADLNLVRKVKEAVSIPVMAKCRIGHFAEAEILEESGVDFIDESEVLTMADPFNHIDKTKFKVPFVCGARNLGEALRRINEGASMIRTKGEAGTGDISQAIKHVRTINSEIKLLDSNLFEKLSIEYRVPINLLETTMNQGRVPVVNFAAGGVATPADAALMMKIGCDGVFVGSGIFTSENPLNMGNSIVNAVTYFDDNKKLYDICLNTCKGMTGINVNTLDEKDRYELREAV